MDTKGIVDGGKFSGTVHFENVSVRNAELKDIQESILTDTEFRVCTLKGKWKKNNHGQAKHADIFVDCDHQETHEESSLENVTDFEKIKDRATSCSNDVNEGDE